MKMSLRSAVMCTIVAVFIMTGCESSDNINTDYDLEVDLVTKEDDRRVGIMEHITWEQMDKQFYYDGDDLGATLDEDGTATLKLWSPPADSVSVRLFHKDNETELIADDIQMIRGDKGVWEIKLNVENTSVDHLLGYFYEYRVNAYGQTRTGLDPYAKSIAAYNRRGTEPVGKAAIIEPSSLGPELEFANIAGFEKKEDAIIYEVHVRDFTVDPSIELELNHPFGTYRALIDKLDYIAELGVTHIQLLPVMEYYHGNQFKTREREMQDSAKDNNYNWGYDPRGYFSPSGMYSENAADPELRVTELKELIHAIHSKGLGVILDVVYNHTARIGLFEDLVPGYYHFMNANGKPKSSYGGGSLGTTHNMTRKLLVDSIAYWVDEYKVDGFRFDLMGAHDAETIQIAYEEAAKRNPNILIIGEGWRLYDGDDGHTGVIPADQGWMRRTDSVAVFSDDIRNELKSGYGSEGEPRFITNGARSIQTIFKNIKALPSNFTTTVPGNVVQYIEAHDDLTLHDIIVMSIKKDPAQHQEEIQRRIRLGNTLILSSQGIAFIHAGQEYGRTKQWQAEGRPEQAYTQMVDESGAPFERPYFINDSYDSSDSINLFDWGKVTEPGVHKQTMAYTQGLIALRKSTNAFRLGNKELIESNVTLIKAPEVKGRDLIIGYKNVATDGTGTYYVFVNADNNERTLTLNEDISDGEVVVDHDEAGTVEVANRSGFILTNNSITLDPLTAVIVKIK